MAALFALVATVFTPFLPILNKYLLRDARPALLAWITNAASLPLLALRVGRVLGGRAQDDHIYSRCSLYSPP